MASQRGGAEYAVTAWTNWNGEALPLRSTLKFTTYDVVNKGLVVPQLLVVTVTNIAAPGSSPLIPALAPGDGVQHVINGTCYYYTSADGKFLTAEQTKAVGQVLTSRARPPGLVAVYVWSQSLPWGEMASAVLVACALAIAGTLAWVGIRFFTSRK